MGENLPDITHPDSLTPLLYSRSEGPFDILMTIVKAHPYRQSAVEDHVENIYGTFFALE